MSSWWPQDLVESIARRRSVILIGSGVSANARTEEGETPPTWGKFLQDAYGELGKKHSHIKQALNRYNYLEACAYLKNELGTNWTTILKDKFQKPAYKASKIHEAIFNLDSRIVASLNFDRIYENYATSLSDGTVIVKNYYDSDLRQTLSGSDRYIIKPHGSIDTVSKMIFTLEDYARVRIEHSSFYEIITSLLHTHTFLCIGCGLSDPDIKLIFEDYKYRYGESPHFITLPRLRTHSQKSTVAARAMAERKTFGHRS